MKIANITAYRTGGAGMASLRIHNKLIENGFDSDIFFLEDYEVKSLVISSIQKIRRLFSKYFFFGASFVKNKYIFLNYRENKSNGLNPKINKLITNVDIILVHWVSNSLNNYDLNNIYKSSNCRIIFVMMDLAHITGGCHYPLNCKNFADGCFDCPALPYSKKHIAYSQFGSKALNVAKFGGEIIAFSDIDLEYAKKSAIPFHKYWRLDIPFEKPHEVETTLTNFLVLPSAYSMKNSRKGIDKFMQVLFILENLVLPDDEIYIYHVDYPESFIKEFSKVKFKKFEYTNSKEKLLDLYLSSSIVLFTSIADSAPQMIIESILTGTKVISFKVGNVKEVLNDSNGVIIEDNSPIDMAKEIYKYYKTNEWKNLGKNSISNSISRYTDNSHFIEQVNLILYAK